MTPFKESISCIIILAVVILGLGYLFPKPASAEEKWSGTGIFVSADGYALTAAHVVQTEPDVTGFRLPAAYITGILNGIPCNFTIVVIDNENDVALIKADTTCRIPDYVPVSEDMEVSLGEVFYVAGYPYGVSDRITQSITVSVGRVARILDNTKFFMHVTAFPGNSGSGLLDSKGNVIGILTNGYDPEGVPTTLGMSRGIQELDSIIQLYVHNKPNVLPRPESVIINHAVHSSFLILGESI